MSNLKVDYQLLESIHSTIGGLVSEFDNMNSSSGYSSYDGSLGSGDIAGAMGDFTGNWNYHRKQIVGSMNNLDQLVTQSIKHFQETDKSLKNELTKK
jgi:hypothetical protein